MSCLKDILSDNNSEKQWQNICKYADKLGEHYTFSIPEFQGSNTETAIKELIAYADTLETDKKIELYQHMVLYAEYFDKDTITFLLKNVKNMNSFDHEILQSTLNNMILEERDKEATHISNITYTKGKITSEIYKALGISYKTDTSLSNYCWKLLCEFAHDAFDLDMSVYKKGNAYAVPVYDAAVIISYGIIIKKAENKGNDFLNKIKNKDYNAINVTEWKFFWNLVFKTLRGLLSEYIKADKKEYGVCHRNNLLCIECSEASHCIHMSSITKVIQSTETIVERLLDVRDKAIKVNKALIEKVEKYFSFLCEKAQSASEDKREFLIQSYLYTLYEYILDVTMFINHTAIKNKNYDFLTNSDFEIDVESGKVVIPFSPPPLESRLNKTEMNSQELLEHILDSLTLYCDKVKLECYLCMLFCPSKSPYAVVIPPNNILSQKSSLFQKSINEALSVLEKSFKKEIKSYV